MEHERLGPYLLEAPLGSGGMGEVWRAVDTRLGRPVAVKLLARAAEADAQARQRFQLEARATSGLNHPNLVTVFDAGEVDGRPFLAMELVEGQTVAALLLDGPLPADRCRELADQALAGLSAAHEAGVLHRDLKPENLMVRRDGILKILDFGLARLLRPEEGLHLTRTGAVIGTPEYIAPEILRGVEPGPASDLFSLGVALYRMASGRRPFPGASSFEILTAMLERAPDPLPEVPEALGAVILRALEKDPARRFPDAKAMRGALEHGTPAAETAGTPVLVVLPLDAAAEDRDLADGITEELIARLVDLPGSRVLGRSTAFRYRGVEAVQAARELCARFALDGRLRRSGSQVRVTAALVDARDGCTVLTSRVEGELRDVFALEDRIADDLASTLREHLGGEAPPPRPAPLPQADTEANELYLRGVHYLATDLPDRGERAAAVLQRAVRLQPRFAAAHGRLAMALVTSLFTAPKWKMPWLAFQASREAHKALDLEPDSPEAHVALAFLALGGRNVLEARRILRKAAAARPGHVAVMTSLAYVTLVLGNVAEAEALARDASRRDPGNLDPLLVLAYALACQDRPEEAMDATERALRLDPAHLAAACLALILDVRLDRRDAARTFAQHLATSSASNVLGDYGLLFHGLATGERTEMTLKDVAPMRITLDMERFLASLFASRGDASSAMTLLHSARRRGYRNLVFLDTDRSLDCLRDLPEFQAYRREIEQAIAADVEF